MHLFGQRVLWFMLATLAYSLFRIGKRYALRVMSSKLAALRADLLSPFLDWPVPRMKSERIGDLMSRTVGDVQVVADTTQTTVTEIFDTGVMMTSNFVALVAVSAGITLVGAAPIPLTLLAASLGGRAVFRRSAKARASA